MELPAAGADVRERADAARNRRRVLDAARGLFAQRDPRGVTMEDIAAAAGVGKATLYRRYPDRTAIAEALLSESERELQEAILHGPPPLGPGTAPGTRLAAFLRALVRFNERHGDLARAVETEEQRLAGGAYGAWRLHVAALLDAAGVAEPALPDQLLGAVAPEVLRHAREVRGLTVAELETGATRLAERVTRAAPRGIEGQ